MDWKIRVREAFGADSPDDDVIEELAQHAAADYEAAVADGRDPVDAAREVAALIASWTADRTVRRRRPRRPPIDDAPPASRSHVAGLAHDFRQALRMLRRQPGYSAVLIVTMALGIGATTSLFSVAYGVLLKPLPWPDADRLVRLYETRHGSTSRFGAMMTNASYTAWRDHPKTIEGLGAWTGAPKTIGGAGDAERVRITLATASLFRLLGVPPLLGSGFSESDGAPGGEPAAILSYGLWQQRFGGRHDVLGRPLWLDGRAHRIVGVMPRAFAFPDRETRAWLAFQVPPVVVTRGGGGLSMFQALARLRPGVTPAQAAAEATARGRNAPDPGIVVVAIFGTKGPIEVTAVRLLDAQTARVRPAILVFLAAVALLLLTATANVASVQLARATTRRREIAIRTALGAGAMRLARQFLIENMVVGICGGLAGLALTGGALRLLPVLLPPGFPRVDDVAFGLPVMTFAIGISLVTGAAFGSLPALQARRTRIVASLAEDGLAPLGGGTRLRSGRLRTAIMTGQIAIACVLLLGAALLTRSFIALTRADPGYDARNVLTARVVLPETGYTPVARAAFLTTLLERMRQVPGVARVAFTTALPLSRGDMLGSFTMRSPRTGTEIAAHSAIRFVSPDYFAALGLRLARGRVFTQGDNATSQPVAVVNRTFADRYLSERALGDRVPAMNRAGTPVEAEVVGVVEDVHHASVTDPPGPELYTCYLQQFDGIPAPEPALVVRTAADPATLVPTLRSIVRQRDPSLALDGVSTMEELVRTSLAQPRLYAVLLGTFAVFALAIAGVGLFGVVGYSVAQRSREIGVRTALGARPIEVVGLVLRQGLGIALAGVVLGLAVAFWCVKFLSTFLYGVTAYDTLSFATVPIVLLAVAGLACVVPARRAAMVDPVRVLRG